MPIEQISNSDLSIEDLPQIGDARSIFKFAMTFNGYEYYGSHSGSGDAFRSFKNSEDQSKSSLTEVRNALFFCCRSCRHMQVDDYIDYYEELYPLLISKVENNGQSRITDEY